MALSISLPGKLITAVSGLFTSSAITEPAVPIIGDELGRRDEPVTSGRFGKLISGLSGIIESLGAELTGAVLSGTLDTSQVTADAITNVEVASNSTGQAVGTTETDLVSVTFTTTGGICVVLAMTTATCTNVTAAITGTVLLKIDSTTLDTRLLGYKQAVANDNIFPVMAMAVTTPTAASHAFKITGDGSAVPSFTFDDNSIIVIEFKR